MLSSYDSLLSKYRFLMFDEAFIKDHTKFFVQEWV